MHALPRPQPVPSPRYHGIDHIALAVEDLEAAIDFFQERLGFALLGRRQINGKHTGMISAEMRYGDITFVLCQGTEPESQVSRLVAHHGIGVAHIALRVDDVHTATDQLRDRGLGFDTSVIEGKGMRQAFSSRDGATGLCIELIERNGESGFQDDSISELFAQLERSGAY
ncbi:VOC family protein [Xanthomonas maliensis]|uniref:VOC family protein n=1 Tax=Xanthomonas maliensis TaxID=1321368 RepID=UPI00039D517E|nr:VOC family protein [Xanthomonas maliensis]KAB7763057.1 glyoxalase [Xanthomonas maliensis]